MSARKFGTPAAHVNRARVDSQRRAQLRTIGGTGLYGALASLGLFGGTSAAQSPDTAFRAKSLGDALKALGIGSPADGAAMSIVAPDVAENGAIVELTLRSALPRTDLMALLLERNPFPLAAVYSFHEGMETEITMNVKMAESSSVVLVARAEGRYYAVRRQVAVTLGGCG